MEFDVISVLYSGFQSLFLEVAFLKFIYEFILALLEVVHVCFYLVLHSLLLFDHALVVFDSFCILFLPVGNVLIMALVLEIFNPFEIFLSKSRYYLLETPFLPEKLLLFRQIPFYFALDGFESVLIPLEKLVHGLLFVILVGLALELGLEPEAVEFLLVEILLESFLE